MQIRTVTREAASQWSESARIEGKDIGEVMDRAGVLLTPERLAAVRAICMEQVAQFLEDTPTSLLTGKTSMTITDFQTFIAGHLRSVAAKEREWSSK